MMDWIILNKFRIDWVSILIFLNLILLSYTKWKYNRKFTSFFKSIDPSVYFNNYGNNFFFSRFFGINILVFSLVNISLILIFILNSFGLIKMVFFEFSILFLFLIFIGFLSYILCSFLGAILGVKRETLAYVFNNLRFLFRISIFVYAILIVHHFYFINTFQFLKISFFCVLFLYYLFSIIIVYRFLEKLNRGKFYLILYLCTLKVTPWVFIYWFIKYI